MNKKRSLRSNKGFTLIEILLVISLLMGIGIIEMRRDLSKVNDATAVSVGKQIAIVGEALDQYMASHINGLQHMGNASSGDQNCTVNSDYCDLNISTLINSGYLPATFNNSVKFGGGYTLRIRRVAPPTPATAASICPNGNPIPIGCPSPYPSGSIPYWQWGLQGIVVTTSAWNDGANINWSMLGAAARSAGPLAGVTQSGIATGLYGGWSIGSNSEFGPGILSDGQLVFLTGSQVNLWSQFVNRSGESPMMGNLDMGGNYLNKTKDIFINGASTNPRNKNISSLLPNWVFKGVYAAKDGDIVPAPLCEFGGVPKIKVLMQVMKGTHAQFYTDTGAAPSSDSAAAAAVLASSAAKHQLNNWADPDVNPPGIPTQWVVHFQDKFKEDSAAGSDTVTPGEGLAELYCNYPDQ